MVLTLLVFTPLLVGNYSATACLPLISAGATLLRPGAQDLEYVNKPTFSSMLAGVKVVLSELEREEVVSFTLCDCPRRPLTDTLGFVGKLLPYIYPE